MKSNDSERPTVSREADRVVERLREAYASVEELKQGGSHRRILQKAADKIQSLEKQPADQAGSCDGQR